MINIIEDLSKITEISEKDLNKLIIKSIWCICNSVAENNLINKNLTELNIGLGKLLILDEDNVIKYKFIPSKLLEKNLIKTLTEGKNPLKMVLEKTLCSRIINTYKDII